jgi:hypothetical protein
MSFHARKHGPTGNQLSEAIRFIGHKSDFTFTLRAESSVAS